MAEASRARPFCFSQYIANLVAMAGVALQHPSMKAVIIQAFKIIPLSEKAR
jgi:hypothetical protein